MPTPNHLPTVTLEFSPGDSPLGIMVNSQNVGWVLVVGGSNVTINGHTYKSNRSYWWWTTNPWTSSFTLSSTTGSLGSAYLPTNANAVYTNGPFSGNAKSFQNISVNYSLKNLDAVVGYAEYSPSNITFYRTGSAQYYPLPLDFISVSAIRNFTGWSHVDNSTTG